MIRHGAFFLAVFLSSFFLSTLLRVSEIWITWQLPAEVESLVCVCCGGIYPHVKEIAEKGDIQWRKPLQVHGEEKSIKFLGHSFDVIHNLIGLETYLERYDVINTHSSAKISDHESFDDWALHLGNKRLLCCPEEKHPTRALC